MLKAMGRFRAWWIGLVVLALLAVILAPRVWHLMASQREVITSPDGRYPLVVHACSSLGLPDAGGDAPGFVQLEDASRRVLEETGLEMVQLVSASGVRWDSDRVSVPLVFDWALPR